MNDRGSCSMMSMVVMAIALVHGASASVTLTPPPSCYASCLSQTLAKVGCDFDNLSCWCGATNSQFTGPLVGCVTVNCDSSDAAAGQSFVEQACAVLISGQSTLPASLATIIPAASSTTSSVPTTPSSTNSTSSTGRPSTSALSTQSIPSTPSTPSTTMMTLTTTTNSAGTVVQSSVPVADASVIATHTDGTGSSTGALIGGIVGGIIGFVIVALLITSVVLYVLVRRSVERRARDREFLRESKDYGGESRSSVAASASDSPEDELREMEPSFWGVVTRPKQALRVVNG